MEWTGRKEDWRRERRWRWSCWWIVSSGRQRVSRSLTHAWCGCRRIWSSVEPDTRSPLWKFVTWRFICREDLTGFRMACVQNGPFPFTQSSRQSPCGQPWGSHSPLCSPLPLAPGFSSIFSAPAPSSLAVLPSPPVMPLLPDDRKELIKTNV